MKTKLQAGRNVAFALFAILALALTAFVCSGIAKPNIAYAEETAKQPLTTQLDFTGVTGDVDGTANGYYWHQDADGTYAARTLVLSGLNMDYTGNDAIKISSGDSVCTIHLADGTTNRIRISLPADFTDTQFRAINAVMQNGKLMIEGGGKLIIEFAPQAGETSATRKDTAIYSGSTIEFKHTGAIEVNCSGLNSKEFYLAESNGRKISYRSGRITLYADVGEETHKVGQYVVFNTHNNYMVPSIAHENAGDSDAIVWQAYEGANIKLSDPGEAEINEALELKAGTAPTSAAVVSSQGDLANKKYARIGKPHTTHIYGNYTVKKMPTATETGIAEGKCVEEDATDELTLPVLTDSSVYTKIENAATTEKDAYDTYTYSKDGIQLTFDIVLSGTRIHHYTYAVTTKPTATATGTATGTCSDGDGATTTLTLPVLTDSAYTKVEHEATTEKDAYNTYTYSKDGIQLTFDIVLSGTKLSAQGLSAGAIAGIAIGSVLAVLIAAYLVLFFAFYKKDKLTGKVWNTIFFWYKK